MRIYSRKYHRHVERQVHFGVGQSTKAACGIVLFSRHVMVSAFGGSDGAVITDDLKRVTCKRCLATRETRLRKLIAIEQANHGIFDRESLCGEQWLLDHALDVSEEDVNAQTLEVNTQGGTVTLSNKIRAGDRKKILHGLLVGDCGR